jgi:hypothetical protein
MDAEDAEDRALITRLFAEVTAVLEEAHAMIVKGQSRKRAARGYDALVRDLQTAVGDAAALAAAAAVIARRAGPNKAH